MIEYISMKNKVINLKLILVLSFVFVLCALASFVMLSPLKKATASTPTSEKILPLSELETYPIVSPVNVYSDDEVVAIIQADNSLVIYKDGKYTKLESSVKKFTSLKQVQRFSDSELIISDNGSVYKVNLTTFDVSLLTFGTELIGCTSFDFNGNYLVTSYGVSAFFYEVTGGVITKKLTPLDNVTDTTIAVNDTAVFYVSNNKIFSRTFASFNDVNEVYSAAPSKIIATNEYLYYILDGEVFRLTLGTKTPIKMIFPESVYDLGKVENATDLTISNGNLLVTDKEHDSIQEFIIEDDKLSFTGIAIAKDKTAYNRIAKAKSVEKFGKTSAILQDYKITLINTEQVDYNESSFTNLLVGDAPDFFAYSGKTIFGAKKDGTAYILDVKTEEKLPVSLPSNVVDICYKCNNYYALIVNSGNSTVYKINPSTGEAIILNNYAYSFISFEIDVSNDFYFATTTMIYKDDGTGLKPYSETYGNTIKKIMTDLAGKLYLLGNKSIFTITTNNSSTQSKLYDVDVNTVQDFCISIDEGEAYFLESGEEYLYKTTALNNVAITSLKTPSDFSTTDEEADVANLKVFDSNTNTNFFAVNFVGDSFEYVDVTSTPADYLFVSEITVDSNFTVYLLANHEGTFIANKKDCTEKTLIFNSSPTEVYTTTTVHAYYLPLITMEMEYSLSFNSEKVLLSKHEKVCPISSFTLFNMEFYYAKITNQLGEEKACYVPSSFTVETLAENLPFDYFTIKQIKATTVYSDKEMTNKIFTLEKTEVRVYEELGKVSRIKYFDGNGWVDGYVSSSAIINKAKDSVRNVLILLAVITSLCGTATFFILKKSN